MQENRHRPINSGRVAKIDANFRESFQEPTNILLSEKAHGDSVEDGDQLMQSHRTMMHKVTCGGNSLLTCSVFSYIPYLKHCKMQ